MIEQFPSQAHGQPHTSEYRMNGRLSVEAESAEQRYHMELMWMNGHPGQRALMLLAVTPPLSEEANLRDVIYYAEKAPRQGEDFALRLGSTNTVRSFQAVEVEAA